MTDFDPILGKASASIAEGIKQAKAAHLAAAELLTRFRMVDTTPLGPTPIDLADIATGQAVSMCIVLSNVLIHQEEENDDFVRACHLREAIDGVKTLIALAAFAREGVEQ
jgi:hypothetical protein